MNAIRAVLDVQRVQQLLSQNALVVRGTPDQIALAEKLVEDLDKARPEVIVDIAVMQISKDRSRTLGFNPPTSATVTLQNNINTTTTTTGRPTGTTGTTTRPRDHDRLNLNTLGNLNATDFQVTIPSGQPVGADERQRHQADSESANSRSGRPESFAEDRRPRAGRDRIVPARHRRRRY